MYDLILPCWCSWLANCNDGLGATLIIILSEQHHHSDIRSCESDLLVEGPDTKVIYSILNNQLSSSWIVYFTFKGCIQLFSLSINLLITFSINCWNSRKCYFQGTSVSNRKSAPPTETTNIKFTDKLISGKYWRITTMKWRHHRNTEIG